MCNIEFLEVEDIEETYVKELIKLKKKDDQVRNNLLFEKNNMYINSSNLLYIGQKLLV